MLYSLARPGKAFKLDLVYQLVTSIIQLQIISGAYIFSPTDSALTSHNDIW
jgi:hypothetical protein